MARPRREVDVVRVRSLHLEGGMSFQRIALLLGRETGEAVSSMTVRNRYLEAGYELRSTPVPSAARGPLPVDVRKIKGHRR